MDILKEMIEKGIRTKSEVVETLVSEYIGTSVECMPINTEKGWEEIRNGARDYILIDEFPDFDKDELEKILDQEIKEAKEYFC